MEAKPVSQVVGPVLRGAWSQITKLPNGDLYLCCICGGQVEPPKENENSGNLKCASCRELQAKKDAELKKKLAEQKAASLLARIPPAYKKTEREKLPFPDSLDKALEWDFNPMGLLIYGPSRSGKSRIAWKLIEREIMSGREVSTISALDLITYPALLMEDSQAASRLVRALAEAELLLMDDVFKSKLSERVEELLFAVLEQRGIWQRPTIVTLNDTPETLRARLSADRGPALIGRLSDYCQPFEVGTNPLP